MKEQKTKLYLSRLIINSNAIVQVDLFSSVLGPHKLWQSIKLYFKVLTLPRTRRAFRSSNTVVASCLRQEKSKGSASRCRSVRSVALGCA